MPRRVPRYTGTWDSWAWGRRLSEQANTALDLGTGVLAPLPWLVETMLQAPRPQPGPPLQGGQGSWEGAALRLVLQGSLATSFSLVRLSHHRDGIGVTPGVLSKPFRPGAFPCLWVFLRSLWAGGQMEQRPPLC